MELDTRAAPASGAGNAPGQRVWAYRKAAWAIEARCVEQDVGLMYRQKGPLREGLEGIENVGPSPAEVVEELLAELYVSPEGCGRPCLLGCGALLAADSSA